MFSNHRGFSTLEILLILALIGAIGFAGWSWYTANQEAETTEVSDAPDASEESEEEEDSYSIPEGWTEYSNPELGFSLAYPEEWGQVEVNEETLTTDPRTFSADFDNSNVILGVTAKDHYQKMEGGRGGGMLDYQGFEEQDGQLMSVRYDDNAQRVVENELQAGYSKLEGFNTDVVYHDSLSFFSSSMAHLMFNLEDSDFPAMNIYVDTNDVDAAHLQDIAETVRILE